MNCKFCNEPLEEGVTVCPACGKAQDEPETEPAQIPEEACEETAEVLEETCGETAEIPVETTCDAPKAAEEEPAAAETAPPKPKLWKLILSCFGCAVLLGVLVFAVLRGMGVEIKFPTNDIHRKDSYTAEEENIEKTADVVVASIGDHKLTNGVLQIHYWNHVYDCLNYYVNYYGTYPFDPEQPLSSQIYDAENDLTWEQYFLDLALQTWHRYESLCILAEQAGHTMSADMQEDLDNLSTYLEETAQTNGYEDVAALIEANYGPGCTFEHYKAYMTTYYIGLDYFNLLTEQVTPTDQEVEAFFTENAADFESSGITADSGLQSSVRHILICPEGDSDEDWAAALSEAEAILAQWKSGEATEESFIALVKEKTEDTASAETGGLYEEINLNSYYVENFQNWAIDSSRQPGDTEIVESTYGYHIMYFVEGQEMWYISAKETLVSERISELVDAAVEENAMKVTYRKIALGDALATEETEEETSSTATE